MFPKSAKRFLDKNMLKQEFVSAGLNWIKPNAR